MSSSEPRGGRRAALRSGLSLTWVAGLAGCGFRLRTPPTFGFRTMAFSGLEPASPMAAALRRALFRADVRVVPGLADADLVLEVLDAGRDKGVVAQTAAGQVRELSLRARLQFRVRRPDGEVAMAAIGLEQRRSLTTTESAALAKEREEDELFRAMEADLADQVLRRLASVGRV